jgi:hypothetical protein
MSHKNVQSIKTNYEISILMVELLSINNQMATVLGQKQLLATLNVNKCSKNTKKVPKLMGHRRSSKRSIGSESGPSTNEEVCRVVYFLTSITKNVHSNCPHNLVPDECLCGQLKSGKTSDIRNIQ